MFQKFKNLLFLFSLIAGGMFINSCEKTEVDPCDDVVCGTNEICVDGTCVELAGEDPCEGVTCAADEVCADGTCLKLAGENPCEGVTCNTNQVCVDGTCVDLADQSTVKVTDNVTADVTWESEKVYILAGRIAVEDGATLTIEAGTIVKGEAGTGANATALIVARGGKLMADGSADAPIIFTSIADEIMPSDIAAGNFISPNLDPDIDGLWGGIIVLGRAPSSFSTNDETFQIEGIPPSDINGLYGGTNPDDNSGVIRYISIRHGGSNIGEGNEINGLTLGGVGRGTVIENVEVIANQDDGIEWFGGTVDVTNAMVWNSGDDALDADQAWAGTMDNFIIICGPTTDHALEIDGPEGAYRDGHTLKNGSVKGHPASELADFRDGAEGVFENIYFFDFPDPAATNGRGDFSLSNPSGTTTTTDNFANGVLVFNNLEVTPPAGVALNVIFRNGTDVHATEVAAGSNTVGADKSVFGWTWAAQAGLLEEF